MALTLLSALPAAAVEVSGIDVPERATAGGRELVLNGAGLRSRFFVSVYVGALYLTEAGRTSLDAVLATPGPKRVTMHIVYDALSSEKVTAAWSEGFEANLSAERHAALAPRIARFNALWPALVEGDRVAVDVLPGEGVQVTVNGASRGRVEGDDLGEAVLRIWLGEEPADAGLKRGMLGG